MWLLQSMWLITQHVIYLIWLQFWIDWQSYSRYLQMITVEKTHLKCVILFYSKIPVQIHKTMLFCSHLNLKPPLLSKIFSQGYAFHLGNYLSTTAPDPFNAKANEKGPRTRPWCTPKKVHTYNKECTLPLSLLWRLW